MTTLTAQPSSTEAPGSRVILEGISWRTYLTLLEELGDHRASRLVYDNGILEITMPTGLHEIIARLLDHMITALADELDVIIQFYGCTTLNREDLAKGVEPDCCYYIQNLRGPGSRSLDLLTDPPPDLAVEVDFTSSSSHKMSVYLSLGVPEVWQYTQQRGVVIFQLKEKGYVACEYSPSFPLVSGVVLTEFLNRVVTEQGDNLIIRAFRQWVREQHSPQK
ncbi:Uma2 family endonuclease [Anthocerotibacter panamensis]|uniref:Uma2 family endonuclease n=1 Tax=Anthocerotibacter panamensis TaxID=2857077 RepID=UPI001C4053AE|nr:Uma2 family endonuclease [Anthocerotibacter panamensis]